MDIALLQYILKKKKEGMTDEEISNNLLSQGWPQEAVTEGLNHVAAHPNQVAFHETTFSSTLLGPMELLNNAFELLMKNIGSAIILSFIPSFLGVLFIVLGFFISYIKFGSASVSKLFETPYSIISTISYVLIGMVIIGMLYAWFYTAMYELFTSEDEKIGWRSALQRCSGKIIPFYWTSFLFSFISTGGFILFIIPGILFSVWFSFAPIIFFTEKIQGMNALLKSREYVRKMTLPIFWRQLFIFGCLMAVNIAAGFLGTIIGSSTSSRLFGQLISFVLNLFVTPFTIAYMYVLYKNVRSMRGNVQINQKSNDKTIFLIVGIIGTLLFFTVFISGFIVLRSVVQTRMNNAKMIQYQMNTSDVERALEMYYIEKGQYPAYLEELTPKYIPSSLLNSPSGPNYMYTTDSQKSSFSLCPQIKDMTKSGCISSRINQK